MMRAGVRDGPRISRPVLPSATMTDGTTPPSPAPEGASPALPGILLGLLLLIVGVAVANSNKAYEVTAYGDGDLTFNWGLFAPFAAGAAICLVLGLAVGSIVNALNRHR